MIIVVALITKGRGLLFVRFFGHCFLFLCHLKLQKGQRKWSANYVSRSYFKNNSISRKM